MSTTLSLASRRWFGLLLTISFTVGSPASASAQGPSGSLIGVVKTEETGAPIPFALVRLLPVDSLAASARQDISNAQGRFRFSAIPVGSYRLQLLRIGYRPVLSAIVEVRSGETNEQELRGSMISLPLPPVIVYGEGTCLSSDGAAADRYLSTLWEDIRRGVELRRTFDMRYRYKRELRQTSETSVPSRPITKRERADTANSEPDSVLIREERNRARRAAEGFGKANSLVLPDEKELIDDAFLRTHCIEPVLRAADGATGIRFRQSSARHNGYGIEGTVWVDTTTRLMRRLEVQHMSGDKPISNVSVEYTDVAVAGTSLRLPTTGSFSLVPVQAPRGSTITGTISFGYWGFEEVRP